MKRYVQYGGGCTAPVEWANYDDLSDAVVRKITSIG
jgi:hypothetical protein